MAINVSVQYNGGLLPDIILLTLCDYIIIGEPLRYHEEFLSLQPMFPPKYFDTFSPGGECSESLDAFIFFFKSYSALQAMAPTNVKTVHQTSFLHNIESNL